MHHDGKLIKDCPVAAIGRYLCAGQGNKGCAQISSPITKLEDMTSQSTCLTDLWPYSPLEVICISIYLPILFPCEASSIALLARASAHKSAYDSTLSIVWVVSYTDQSFNSTSFLSITFVL